jgi:tetratricopeptide (TPR) repeat protein
MLKEAVESYEMFNPPFYPLNGELYYYYAYTLESLNELTEAEKYYYKAINDSPNNHNAYFRLIELYKKENQLDKMKEVLEAGKKSFPRSNEQKRRLRKLYLLYINHLRIPRNT